MTALAPIAGGIFRAFFGAIAHRSRTGHCHHTKNARNTPPTLDAATSCDRTARHHSHDTLEKSHFRFSVDASPHSPTAEGLSGAFFGAFACRTKIDRAITQNTPQRDPQQSTLSGACDRSVRRHAATCPFIAPMLTWGRPAPRSKPAAIKVRGHGEVFWGNPPAVPSSTYPGQCGLIFSDPSSGLDRSKSIITAIKLDTKDQSAAPGIRWSNHRGRIAPWPRADATE